MTTADLTRAELGRLLMEMMPTNLSNQDAASIVAALVDGLCAIGPIVPPGWTPMNDQRRAYGLAPTTLLNAAVRGRINSVRVGHTLYLETASVEAYAPRKGARGRRKIETTKETTP